MLVATAHDYFLPNELLCARFRRKAVLLDTSFEDRFYAYYEKCSANLQDVFDMNEALAYAMFEKKVCQSGW